MLLAVTANVRKCGAIGMFYAQDFSVEVPGEVVTREQIRDYWLARYGKDWELYCLVRWIAFPKARETETY